MLILWTSKWLVSYRTRIITSTCIITGDGQSLLNLLISLPVEAVACGDALRGGLEMLENHLLATI
jgi:hypothetical protein